MVIFKGVFAVCGQCWNGGFSSLGRDLRFPSVFVLIVSETILKLWLLVHSIFRHFASCPLWRRCGGTVFRSFQCSLSCSFCNHSESSQFFVYIRLQSCVLAIVIFFRIQFRAGARFIFILRVLKENKLSRLCQQMSKFYINLFSFRLLASDIDAIPPDFRP